MTKTVKRKSGGKETRKWEFITPKVKADFSQQFLHLSRHTTITWVLQGFMHRVSSPLSGVSTKSFRVIDSPMHLEGTSTTKTHVHFVLMNLNVINKHQLWAKQLAQPHTGNFCFTQPGQRLARDQHGQQQAVVLLPKVASWRERERC